MSKSVMTQHITYTRHVKGI